MTIEISRTSAIVELLILGDVGIGVAADPGVRRASWTTAEAGSHCGMRRCCANFVQLHPYTWQAIRGRRTCTCQAG